MVKNSITNIKDTVSFASKNVKARAIIVASVVIIFILGAVTGYNLVSSSKNESQVTQEEELHTVLAKQRMGDAEDIVVTDTDTVSFEESESKYHSLSVDSPEDAVQSLKSVYEYDMLKNLSVERLYSEEYQVLLDVYTSEDNTFAMGVYDTNTVTFISIKGNDELKEKLKTFAKGDDNNTGLKFKEIDNGFILER